MKKIILFENLLGSILIAIGFLLITVSSVYAFSAQCIGDCANSPSGVLLKCSSGETPMGMVRIRFDNYYFTLGASEDHRYMPKVPDFFSSQQCESGLTVSSGTYGMGIYCAVPSTGAPSLNTYELQEFNGSSWVTKSTQTLNIVCPSSPSPVCTSNWQCRDPLDGYEHDLNNCEPDRLASRCNVTPSCVPDCSNASNVCLGQSYLNNCSGTCWGSKVTNCECAANTLVGNKCYDGCKYCDGTLNHPPTCSISVSSCGTINVNATDPDGNSISRVMLYHDRKPEDSGFDWLAQINNSSIFSYNFTGEADGLQHTVRAVPYDQYGLAGSTCDATYTKLAPVDRCDVYYTMTVNGVEMPWGADNENNFGYLEGSNTSGNFNWQARVKGIMEDANGKVTLVVTGHKDSYKTNQFDKCNSVIYTPGEQLFTQTKTYDCSIPEGIELVPDSIEFSEVNDNLYNSEDTQAYIRCTKTDEKVDITSNDVDVDKNDLEVCINVDYLGNSAPYKNYELNNNQLFSRCEGNVDFTITDFVYNNEHWGEMNGSLNVVYQPAADNTSEKFEYSGDVIVDPPPGFEEFVFPSF